MKICGITAEYNPLHNGHVYHIEKTRQESGCDVLVAVMSGNWVQRGEPAVIDKWKRAEAAVRNGIDAVIELPFPYACQSASVFAHGAVSILKKSGVSAVSFGSECGNAENLAEIASTSINPDHLREMMNSGMSYPKAYSLLTSAMMPNDILGVCYMKEIAGTEIQPIVIERTGSYNDENLSRDASALAIRTALKNGKDVSQATVMSGVLENSYHAYWDAYYPYLRTYLLMSPPQSLCETFLFSEGIETMMANSAAENDSWDGFLKSCVSYRYTASRIRRCCVMAACRMTKQEIMDMQADESLRILAFNDNGRKWLKEMKNREVKVASRFADMSKKRRDGEYRTTLMYASVMPEEIRKQILQREIEGASYIR